MEKNPFTRGIESPIIDQNRTVGTRTEYPGMTVDQINGVATTTLFNMRGPYRVIVENIRTGRVVDDLPVGRDREPLTTFSRHSRKSFR